jgi:hypothetical protein
VAFPCISWTALTNSNINRSIFPEEKDYMINKVVTDFVNTIVTNEETSVTPYISYTDIKKYTNALQKHIHSISLATTEIGNYVESKLPRSNATTILNSSVGATSTDLLIDGVTYKVIEKGTIDLSDFGYEVSANITNDDIFDCELSNLIGFEYSGDRIEMILKPGTYKIINAGLFDFTDTDTDVNVKDNNPNTIFTISEQTVLVNMISYSEPSDDEKNSTILKPLKLNPIWLGAKIKPMNDLKYYLLNSSSSTVTQKIVNSGVLKVNNTYIVSALDSTVIDLSSVGGVATPTVGYKFICTAATALTWNSAELLNVTDVVNRLVLIKNVDNYLKNTFGIIKSSPISVIINNKVRVYNDNVFDVPYINLTYVIKPTPVSKELQIDCDLPEYLHPLIVDICVQQLMSIMGLQANRTNTNEMVENPKIVK